MTDREARRWGGRAALTLALVAIFAFGIWYVFSTVLNHDVGWLLHVARRVREGAVLYEDVFEINPPLIVWVSGVAVAVADVLALPAFQVYRVGVFTVVALSVGLTAWIARRLFPGCPALRAVLVTSLAFALVVLPEDEFGQREHLTLALTFPYLCLAATRRWRASEPSAEASSAVSQDPHATPGRSSVELLVAGVAGVGFAIKPHFVLVWLLVEGWLAIRGGRSFVRSGAPALGVGAVLVGYGVAALVIHPEYLSMLRLLAEDYGRFSRQSLAELVRHWSVGLAGVLTIIFLAFRRLEASSGSPTDVSRRGDDLRRSEELAALLLVAAWGFLLAFVVQGKGSSYHRLPANGCLFVVAFLVAERLRHGRRLASRIFSGTVLVLSVAVATSIVAVGVGETRVWRGRPAATDTPLGRFVRFLERVPEGAGFYTIDVHHPPTFPAVNYAGADWPYRFPALWPFREALSGGPSPSSASAVVGLVTEELVATEPAYLIVLTAFVESLGAGGEPDRIHFFSDDAAFTRFFRDYVYLEELGAYRVYRKVTAEGAAQNAGPTVRRTSSSSATASRSGSVERLTPTVQAKPAAKPGIIS